MIDATRKKCKQKPINKKVGNIHSYTKNNQKFSSISSKKTIEGKKSKKLDGRTMYESKDSSSYIPLPSSSIISSVPNKEVTFLVKLKSSTHP